MNKSSFDNLFISGNPGSGKTMVVNHILDNLERDGINYLKGKLANEKITPTKYAKKFNIIKLNAMSFKNPLEIYLSLLQRINQSHKFTSITCTNALEIIEEIKKFITSDPKTVK